MLSPDEAREMALAAQREAEASRNERVHALLEDLYDRIEKEASEGGFEISVMNLDKELDDALEVLRIAGYKISYDEAFRLNTINWG